MTKKRVGEKMIYLLFIALFILTKGLMANYRQIKSFEGSFKLLAVKFNSDMREIQIKSFEEFVKEKNNRRKNEK